MKTRTKLIGVLAVVAPLLIVLRYAAPVVRTFGLTSPLSRNRTLIKYVVLKQVDRDARRVRLRLDRLRRGRVQNVNSGAMKPALLDDLTPNTRERPAGVGRDSIIRGTIHDMTPDARGARRRVFDPSLDDEGGADGANWTVPSGDDWGRKHSSLQLINRSNVGDLKLVHVIDTQSAFDTKWTNNVEAPPLNWGAFVYWLSSDDELVAVNVVSGAIAWHLTLPAFDFSRRGFVLRERSGALAPVLYVPFGPFIAAIDAGTGKLVPGFGDAGILALGATTVSPVLWRSDLVIGLYEDATIVGVDIESGTIKWRVPLHPANRNFEGGAPWSGMAIDRARDRLFVTTGNPRPALNGITRPGDNKNSNSVIAVDLRQKAIAWAFQEVRHDLWDFDVPSGPILARVDVNHRPVDVVIAVTKIGNTLMLDRDTGRPIFDFRLRQAPPSNLLREQTASYQPAVETPEPLIGIAFDSTMITNVSPASHRFVATYMATHRMVSGWFRPPELNRDVVSFGLHGGAEWHGASVIPEDNKLFVAVNMIPWVLRIYLQGAPGYVYANPATGAGQAVYAKRCASCHLPSRDGQFESAGEVATSRVPSLHGYTMFGDNAALFEVDRFRVDHATLDVSQQELDAIWSLFKDWDRDVLEKKKAVWAFQWRQLLDSTGLPASAPPWGKIVAMDLSTGKKAWERPFGTKVIHGDTVQTGSASYGGLISTSGKLLFATGTDDGYVVAIDAASGKTLWRYKMAAAGSAPPITFSHNGRQYLCVIATGGRFHNFVDRAGKLYIFAL